jgi:MATE family multidrug resistance protein
MDDKPGAGVHAPLIPDSTVARCGPAVAETERLLHLAVPMVATFVLQTVVNMVSLMFVGHLGELPLAGASLATSLANVTGYSVIVRPSPSCSCPPYIDCLCSLLAAPS